MAFEAAALLDELMGSHRNALPGERVRETKWSDPEVCKHFLCGFCPSELFTNTKSDVGPCDKLHDERLKRLYQESDRYGKVGYEDEFLHYLEKLVRDLDRRIERGRERLQKSVTAKQKVLQGESGISSDKLKALNDEINTRVAELERLGTMGQVEEAQESMKKVEELERERERERMHLVNMTHKRVGGFDLDAHDFHEKMELCDVCGSFLVIGDVQLRVDAHLLGKQHLGFARIRSTISELKKAKEEKMKKIQEDIKDIKDIKDDEKDRHVRGRSTEGRDRRGSDKNKDDEKDRHVRSRSREREHKPPSSSSRGREQRPVVSPSQGHDRRRSRHSRSRERAVRRRSRSQSRGRAQGKRRSVSRERDKKEKKAHRSRSRSRERRKERTQEKDRVKAERTKEGEEREKTREEEDKDMKDKPKDRAENKLADRSDKRQDR